MTRLYKTVFVSVCMYVRVCDWGISSVAREMGHKNKLEL